MADSKSLLFVDDEEEILEILVDIFSEEGYELHTATRADDAIKIVDRHHIDFVLSDLKLPDSSGLELLNSIAQRRPDIIRVLTSGYLDVKFGRVARDAQDGTLYLSKPWDITCLKQLVCASLDQ
jgi:DNA-binding NtrC family response regulator